MPTTSGFAKRTASRGHVRVAIYTRRSTDEENQPFTVKVQESKLDSYVASQDGWAIVARYSDDVSGAKIDRRGLGLALAAARAGEFDVLLVYRVDRFSRRICDLVMLLDELDASGVVFRSATEPFDTAAPVGRMLVHMLGVFAEFERDVIIDRVVSGMEKKASKGQWTLGIPPYGYAVDPATGHLRPVPEESPVMSVIFELYTGRGMGTRAVANELTQRGYRRRSGRRWSFKTVTDTLRNPAYIGTVAFRDVRVDDAHPAIIDPKTFARAGTLLTERGANRAKAASLASDYHLTGKIICPRCRQAYLGTAATGRNRAYRYYTCHTRNRFGSAQCDAPRIDADSFDDHVLAALCDFYRTRTDLITDAIASGRDAYRATRHAVEAELRAVSSSIAQKEIAVDRHFADYEAGKIDKTVLESRLEKLGRELRDLSRHRDELRLRLDDESQNLADLDLEALRNGIDEVIASGTTAARRSLCEAAIHQLRLNVSARTAHPRLPSEHRSHRRHVRCLPPSRVAAAQQAFTSGK
ncbi:recombinase family protein [Phytohabitans sp. ZYX-F-186]|uniref:Recombinase family protein n=1 Tax=Phytohabitans maris TaxID=3071409 RepID=A0ABU0ZFU9_9ACTN|nr:recombinase family protein [Phytohabitans sp. ZYX-F-186]MDQ7905938.1 recombinase family protein [Phytohabitans sp. ZYX-F-186]